MKRSLTYVGLGLLFLNSCLADDRDVRWSFRLNDLIGIWSVENSLETMTFTLSGMAEFDSGEGVFDKAPYSIAVDGAKFKIASTPIYEIMLRSPSEGLFIQNDGKLRGAKKNP